VTAILAHQRNRGPVRRCRGQLYFCQIRTGERAIRPHQPIKKRLGLYSPRRLGSPPPELPNHFWIVGLARFSVNVTLVIAARVVEAGLSKLVIEAGLSKLGYRSWAIEAWLSWRRRARLLLPALAGVGSGPQLRSRGRDSSVLRVEELNVDDVPGKDRAT